MIIVDDASFSARSLNNFLWSTFTRSDPATDLFGVHSNAVMKHWGCDGPLVIDARRKPWHAPPLLEDPAVNKKIDALATRGGPLASTCNGSNGAAKVVLTFEVRVNRHSSCIVAGENLRRGEWQLFWINPRAFRLECKTSHRRHSPGLCPMRRIVSLVSPPFYPPTDCNLAPWPKMSTKLIMVRESTPIFRAV